MNVDGSGKKFGDDRVVQEINRLISLNDDDTKKNNVILQTVLKDIIDTMKDSDDFFRDHFQNIMFVGSYYKGTKVGKPEEFDLDLIIQLPVKYDSVMFERDLPGYTKLKLSTDSYLPKWQNHSKLLSKWVTEKGYLKQDEFRQWMEGLFTSMIPKLATKEYKLKHRKSGPAFTLVVEYPDAMEMHVDLVPVLEFKNQPPVPGNFKDASWLAVPKPLKVEQENPNIYWRMSFYNFEKNILKNHGYLKPAIRQVKKLRDRYDWKIIASYYIETLFMHEQRAIETSSDSRKFGSTELLLRMLNRLKEACEKKQITNYWDEHDNLIEGVKTAQLASIIGLLGKIIKNIEKDPLKIAEHLLTPEELKSISESLEAIRNSRESGKSTGARSTKGNEVVQQPQSDSCNATAGSDAAAGSLTGTLLMSLQAQQWLQVTGAQKESPPLAADNSTTIAPEEQRSSSNDKSSESFADILNMLKSIHSEVADTKDAVNLLTRRVLVVEDKIDALLSRFNGPKEEQLFFGTRSIGSLPINSRVLSKNDNTTE